MALLLPSAQRRGTRFVFLDLAAPEAVLVEGLALAPQVEHGPAQPCRQHGQRLALAALLRLPVLPAFAALALPQEQAGRLPEGPAQVAVADLLAACAFDLASRLVVATHQPRIRQELPGAAESTDVVDLIKQGEGEDLADAGDGLQAVEGLHVIYFR